MSDPHVAEWIEDRPALPAWADPDRMDRGTAFFAEWGVELGLGLFLSSLPLAYAAHDGVQVLALTSQLETNTKRRVLESAQFVLDVTTPGGLFPGNEPYDTVRLVRLMHAGVRNLVLTDPRIEHTSDESVWPRWDDAWGAPINQEHLLGAMISYSSSLLHVLDRLHVDYDATGASDYCHLWNVVGWLLGIDPAVLPLERAEMDDLELLIRERNERWSQAGTDMTKALLELVRSFIRIPPLRGLAVSTTRLFIGDDTAKLLEVPPADWTGRLVGGMRTMSGRCVVARRTRSRRTSVGVWLLATGAHRLRHPRTARRSAELHRAGAPRTRVHSRPHGTGGEDDFGVSPRSGSLSCCRTAPLAGSWRRTEGAHGPARPHRCDVAATGGRRGHPRRLRPRRIERRNELGLAGRPTRRLPVSPARPTWLRAERPAPPVARRPRPIGRVRRRPHRRRARCAGRGTSRAGRHIVRRVLHVAGRGCAPRTGFAPAAARVDCGCAVAQGARGDARRRPARNRTRAWPTCRPTSGLCARCSGKSDSTTRLRPAG